VNRRIATAIAAGAAGAVAFALPLTALPKGTEHYNKSGDTVIACPDSDDTLTFHAPSDLWPPNHKYYDDITVTFTDASGDRVDLTTTGTHDGYDGDTGTEMNGSGNTADDITSDDEQAAIVKGEGEDGNPNVVATEGDDDGSVTTDWDARAERSGRIKEGRTYTLSATGTSADDDPACSGSITMRVPHDMRKSNR